MAKKVTPKFHHYRRGAKGSKPRPPPRRPPGPRLDDDGWPSAYQGLRDWFHKKYRKFAYDMWRFARKNWFWVLVAIFATAIYLRDIGESGLFV